MDGGEHVLAAASTTWLGLLVARLAFVTPNAKAFDMRALVEDCLRARPATACATDEVDDIVLALLDFDVHLALKNAVAAIRSTWFVAHLTDLLWHARQIERYALEYVRFCGGVAVAAVVVSCCC